MRVAVATRARVILRRGMYASDEPRRLIGVAGLAFNLRNVFGVRVLLDVSVAVVALQAAMDAGTECLPVHRNAMPGGILHRLIAMTCQAICLRQDPHGCVN